MRQKTINVNGDKIKITVRASGTRAGNYNGYIVRVNDKRYHFYSLMTADEAEDKAFVKYIMENRMEVING